MSVTFSQVVNVFLALAVVYYVMGMIVSVSVKWILDYLEVRGDILENYLKMYVLGFVKKGQDETMDALKAMPQLDSLRGVRYARAGLGFFTGETTLSRCIERIPPQNLVDALFNLSEVFDNGEAKVKDIVNLLPETITLLDGNDIENPIKPILLNLSQNGCDSVNQLRKKLEGWYKGLMDRAAQEFKVRARQWVVALSFIFAVALGIDSIELTRKYWSDSVVLATANIQADAILQSSQAINEKNANMQALVEQLNGMKAINLDWWNRIPENASLSWWLLKIIGLLITTLAISQGSSFWYDIIRQIKGERASTPQKDDQLEMERPSVESMLVKTTKIEVIK